MARNHTGADARPSIADTNQSDNAFSTTPTGRRITAGIAVALVALAVVLIGIIAVAFRGSWTAHRDAALAAHFDATGATLYPFAPDGLILIALIAAMVLRNDRRARLYALTVVGVFTVTSFVINHLHGLGQFALDPATGLRPDLTWPVVALIAGQVIGAIFFGSHLIVSALRYLFPSPAPDQGEQPAGQRREGGGDEPASAPGKADEPVIVHADPDPHEVARIVYGIALDLDMKVGRDRLAKACQISSRQAGRIRSDVETDREEAAAREAEQRAAEQAQESAGDEVTAGPGIEDQAAPSATPALNGTAVTS